MPSSSRAQKVTKSTLSMFLRTRCDKALFLSLHNRTDMAALGLPEPVKRPGIGILSVAGNEFEVDRNDQLVRLLNGIVKYRRGPTKFDDINLEATLGAIATVPAVILQGKFSINSIKDHVLTNIGLSPTDILGIPDIADFIPDVLVVRSAHQDDFEVMPDGSRIQIPSTEARLAIDLYDIKHTSEANPSYCAEVALYVLMLSNWLASKPALRSRFFVTTDAYLWTRYKQGNSELEKLEAVGGATADALLSALQSDSENANLRFYLATVRDFFENVARVNRLGTVSPGAWTSLDWHVAGPCSSCDWLGDKRHLSNAQSQVVDANPSHYCMPNAAQIGHLSLVPGITRGAKKTLQLNAINDTPTLAGATGHPALQLHTLLKREARSLPVRSTAILSQTMSLDNNAVIASLARYANFQLFVSVNFDSSAGLLTGLALSGLVTTYARGQSPTRFNPIPYIVNLKDLQSEWEVLEGFLGQVADCIQRAERAASGSLTGQIHFWEERQFKELCNAIGRHLPRVLALTERKAAALAWIFSPDELIARPESLEASTVAIIEDVVKRMVFTPTPHVITLFDTAEAYPSGPVQTVRDSYYREYLSNGIPRERIYEIWSNRPQVKRGSSVLPRNTVISEYAEALKKQCRALESICERLRRDYQGHFKAKAPHIPTSIPRGAPSVAFDAKLWIWWDALDFNTTQLEAHIRLAMDGERLEASYEAILLSQGRQQGATSEFDFVVAASSVESKFREESMLTLGKIGRPGMPLEYAANLLNPNAPTFSGNPDLLTRPLWSVLRVSLISFDRHQRLARVSLSAQDPKFVSYLIANSAVDLLNDVFLLETKKPSTFDWSETSRKILQEIGNPQIAVPDPNAAIAMGIRPSQRRGGSSPLTPVAEVLWNASALEQRSVVPASVGDAAATHLTAYHRLNNSQVAAIKHAVEKALTVIWGPPGTGKTNTLAGALHGLAHQASVNRQPLKILVTGPTYKAVEEVMARTFEAIAADGSTICTMYMGYSKSRAPSLNLQSQPNISFTPFILENTDPDCQACLQDLSATATVTIVGVQVQQARRFPRWLNNNALLHPVFDVVVIDESSQVRVSHSLSALGTLKTNARLIVAGDHMQMPPIMALEPPADVAYMIGSIQTYLSERRFGQPMRSCVLDINYRSAGDIVYYARGIGYPASLSAAFPDTKLKFMPMLPTQGAFPAHLPWCPAYPEILLPTRNVTALLHEDEISSQGNSFEARIVAGLVWMLRQTVSREIEGRGVTSHSAPTAEEFWGKCVGVVTPHRAQRALVIQELNRLFPGEENLIDGAIDTVERFQGGERHTVIVTFGVADTEIIVGEEAFLMQMERTNVAVSRAMAKCIMIMPKTLAAHIPEDKRALSTAHAVKNYIEEFCNVRLDTQLMDTAQSRWAQIRYHG